MYHNPLSDTIHMSYTAGSRPCQSRLVEHLVLLKNNSNLSLDHKAETVKSVILKSVFSL